MDLQQLIALAVIQGLTEFLPISSSAHLILLPVLLGWEDQGLAFDIAVHVGTLIAVILYFRREVWRLLADWSRSLARRQTVGDSRLAWGVLWGVVPVVVAGLLFSDLVERELRSPLVIAYATVGFGLLLGWADWRGARRRDEHQMNWLDILIIGVAQALALIPGTSRSGITMTAGLMRGLTRQAAARFSFLLSIPVLAMAGGWKSLELMETGVPADLWLDLFWAVVLSAVSALICIHVFLKLLARVGMWPFVVYRLLLGAWLLYVFS